MFNFTVMFCLYLASYLVKYFYILQGLFVPFACVGSGDPVRVLRLFHNEYSGYCCIHLLCKAMYNLSLPRLSANYYGLPTTVQLRAAHETPCSLFGVSQSTAQVLYCTCLERYIYRTVQYCYLFLTTRLNKRSIYSLLIIREVLM